MWPGTTQNTIYGSLGQTLCTPNPLGSNPRNPRGHAPNNPKYYSWFRVNDTIPLNTRADKDRDVLKAVQTRTNLYRDSPLPYLTNILNEYLEPKKRK